MKKMIGDTRTNKELRSELKRGDILMIQEITRQKQLNNGKGFSSDYITKVTKDERNNDDIWTIVKALIHNREKLIAAHTS